MNPKIEDMANPFPPQSAEQAFGLLAYPHWDGIEVSGTDAVNFLQGQLSNDIALLSLDTPQLAGYCSAKGRLLASFIVVKTKHTPQEQEITLICRSDIAQMTIKRLVMFVLRAKVQIRLKPTEKVSWTNESLAAQKVKEIQSGIAHITLPLVDQFVPQMLNYESVNGVNFKKGCYPGQEVVARSQFRGAIKRRTYLVTFDPSNALVPMSPVFAHESAQGGAVVEVGYILQSTAIDDGLEVGSIGSALVCMFSAYDGQTVWSATDNPVQNIALTQSAMPYALKLDI